MVHNHSCSAWLHLTTFHLQLPPPLTPLTSFTRSSACTTHSRRTHTGKPSPPYSAEAPPTIFIEIYQSWRGGSWLLNLSGSRDSVGERRWLLQSREGATEDTHTAPGQDSVVPRDCPAVLLNTPKPTPPAAPEPTATPSVRSSPGPQIHSSFSKLGVAQLPPARQSPLGWRWQGRRRLPTPRTKAAGPRPRPLVDAETSWMYGQGSARIRSGL